MDGYAEIIRTPHCELCHKYVDWNTVFDESTFFENDPISYGTCKIHGMVTVYWTEYFSTKPKTSAYRNEHEQYMNMSGNIH